MTRVLARLDHHVRRARYLVLRAKKAASGLVVSALTSLATIETLLPDAEVETKALAVSIVGLATALGVYVPRNVARPDELDHAPTDEDLAALEGVDVDAPAPYVVPASPPPWEK